VTIERRPDRPKGSLKLGQQRLANSPPCLKKRAAVSGLSMSAKAISEQGVSRWLRVPPAGWPVRDEGFNPVYGYL